MVPVEECPFCGREDAPEYEFELQEQWLEVDVDVSAATHPETELPTSLSSGDKTLRVTAVLSIWQDHPRAVGFTSQGEAGLIRYVLDVEGGKCLVERRPRKSGERSEDAGKNRWVLTGVSSVELYNTFLGPRVIGEEPEPPEAPPWPKPWLRTNMRAFTLIYKLETECRFFVYRLLRGAFADKFDQEWWNNERFWSNRKDLSGIDEVKRRFDEANRLRDNETALPYLVREREQHIFTYFLFTDLTKMLEVFHKLFLDKLESERAGIKNIVLGALRTVEGLRNMVAHNRVLCQENFEVLEANVRTILEAIKRFPG